MNEDHDDESMDFLQRCTYFNRNPVFLHCNFQYQVQVFFKVIVIDRLLGKVKYHTIRVEFQACGIPNVHSFFWIIDALELSN